MKTMKLFSMAAAALLMAACSNSDDFDVQKPAETAGVYHFEATIAAPNADASMRTVYTEDGATINVKWKVDDQIALVHNGKKDVATVTAVDGSGNATIEATITGSPKDNDDVYLAYPADAVYSATPSLDYGLPFTPNPTTFNKVRSQDGTLKYIQDNLDLRMGSGQLAVSGSDVTLKESVSIPSIICIWKLTLQDDAATPNALSATQLTFVNNKFTQAKATNTSGKSEYYLCVVPSFIPDPSGTFSFVAVGSDTYTFSTTGLSLTAGKYYQSTLKMAKPTNLSSISGTEYTVKNVEVLTGTLSSDTKINIADGATVMLKNVNITNLGDGCDWAGINCLGNATLVLEGTNTVCAGRASDGYNNYPGIWIAPDKTLTIQGTGSLTASSNGTNPWGAGIGGGYGISCGNITISGGTITATGGQNAAGIGGGRMGSCGNITISGGTVTATGGINAAGIGGGYCGASNDITISGGTVTAEGGDYSAGIGSGSNGTCGDIVISGGTVSATGGGWSAGIGSGRESKSCGTITIKNTVTSVIATKGDSAPNSIGAGQDSPAITVNIETGTNVTQK